MRHPLSAKVGTNFADKRGRSVGIVRSRTKAIELVSFSETSAALHGIISVAGANTFYSHSSEIIKFYTGPVTLHILRTKSFEK
jgi:hypothetical protein